MKGERDRERSLDTKILRGKRRLPEERREKREEREKREDRRCLIMTCTGSRKGGEMVQHEEGEREIEGGREREGGRLHYSLQANMSW